MLHIINDYYIKKYGKNLILLKKNPQKTLEIPNDDDIGEDIDEETGGVIYDAKHYKRLGYYSNIYTALLELDKINTVESFNNFDTFEQFLSAAQVFRDELLSFYKKYTEESLKTLREKMSDGKNLENTEKKEVDTTSESN